MEGRSTIFSSLVVGFLRQRAQSPPEEEGSGYLAANVLTSLRWVFWVFLLHLGIHDHGIWSC
jgi:hypothetical protein